MNCVQPEVIDLIEAAREFEGLEGAGGLKSLANCIHVWEFVRDPPSSCQVAQMTFLDGGR